MGQDTSGTSHQPLRDLPDSEPVTGYESKKVMTTAERRDSIKITAIVSRFCSDTDVPEELTVIQRRSTFYGPKLTLHSGSNEADQNYILTAPGPDSHLFLWRPETSPNGRIQSWTAAAEVKACLPDELLGYKLCPDCNEPFQSLRHERLAAVGECPNE